MESPEDIQERSPTQFNANLQSFPLSHHQFDEDTSRNPTEMSQSSGADGKAGEYNQREIVYDHRRGSVSEDADHPEDEKSASTDLVDFILGVEQDTTQLKNKHGKCPVSNV